MRPVRVQRLDAMVKDGLPEVILPATKWLVSGKLDPETTAIAAKIEQLRAKIAAGGLKRVDIIYSPPPGSNGSDAETDLHIQAGETKNFTMARVARTGKVPRWGTALHLIAKAAQSRVMLELGACAGISGSYLASAPSCERFITIEGSPPLAELSRNTLGQISPKAEVITGLFDDVLTDLLPTLDKVDLAYIDGHHEKVATIHYFNRIAPKLSENAVVIFDDISWSVDMREMWDELIQRKNFSHTFDFGEIGVCIMAKPGTTARHWDMQPLSGRMLPRG